MVIVSELADLPTEQVQAESEDALMSVTNFHKECPSARRNVWSFHRWGERNDPDYDLDTALMAPLEPDPDRPKHSYNNYPAPRPESPRPAPSLK